METLHPKTFDLTSFFEAEQKLLNSQEAAMSHTLEVFQVNPSTNKEKLFSDPDTFFYGILNDSKNIKLVEEIKTSIYKYCDDSSLTYFKTIDTKKYPKGFKAAYEYRDSDEDKELKKIFQSMLSAWIKFHNINEAKFLPLLQLQNFWSEVMSRSSSVESFAENFLGLPTKNRESLSKEKKAALDPLLKYALNHLINS